MSHPLCHFWCHSGSMDRLMGRCPLPSTSPDPSGLRPGPPGPCLEPSGPCLDASSSLPCYQSSHVIVFRIRTFLLFRTVYIPQLLRYLTRILTSLVLGQVSPMYTSRFNTNLWSWVSVARLTARLSLALALQVCQSILVFPLPLSGFIPFVHLVSSSHCSRRLCPRH